MNTDSVPLCVDLDGSLTPVDTLHESLLELCRRQPAALLSLPFWIARGKAHFKHQVEAASEVDVTLLPIRAELLEWLQAQRASGRRLVLATAANRRLAERVAERLQLFDEVIASNETENLAGEGKRIALVQRFGIKGFDYVGNDTPDLHVWRSARQAVVVGSDGLVGKARQVAEVTQVFPVKRPTLRSWLRAVRLHQWVKNVLVFIPALMAHQLSEPGVLLNSVLAFVSFGLCASSVYLINDLLDLASDRRHPRKRARPFAAGTLSARSGLVLAALLLGGSALLALTVSPLFCGMLGAYYLLTWAYSLRLKRAALVDVLTLAGLYTLRIIAGSAATQILPSFWLLAFSMFVFLCLGIIKRHAELFDARQAGRMEAHGRGYSSRDLELLLTMGMTSGFSAVVVVALYINSPDSQSLYPHHQLLWLICPLLLYWIMRMWLLASRGQMNDDPVVFALRDRISLATLGIAGALAALASH